MLANNLNVTRYEDYVYAINCVTIKLSNANTQPLHGLNSYTWCSHLIQMLSGLLSGTSGALMSSDNDQRQLVRVKWSLNTQLTMNHLPQRG